MQNVDSTSEKQTGSRRPALFILASWLLLALLSGCSTTLVAPYDAQLVSQTEAFYKKAALVVETGRAASPKTDDERQAITQPETHAAHFSQFESQYNQLIIDAEALILRAMASSDEIDQVGQRLQAKLGDLIETALPSACLAIKEEFGRVSLTAANFIDLKCIITRWKQGHSDTGLTQGTLLLKKANWEGRKRLLFNAVVAIQRAEAFKNN